MKIFTDRKIKHLFCIVFLSAVESVLLSAVLISLKVGYAELYVLGLSVCTESFVLAAMYLYFENRHKIMEEAIARIKEYVGGDEDIRIHCNDEDGLYRLFHEVNSLVSILNAHVGNEERGKRFMKDTISDISHQLKTPLTALNICNGTIREDAEDVPAIREFTALPEQGLDRIETLVRNLLKITKLDAGTITLEKTVENASDTVASIERHFAFQVGQEGKTLSFFRDDVVVLLCNRDWLTEAVGNVVRNALDHTKAGNSVSVRWRSFASMVQIVVKDNGSGIHPEDIHYIFKRFYRSRFSKDTQGVGLGLPLAKAIVETHGEIIEADSMLGTGTVFTINSLVSTKL